MRCGDISDRIDHRQDNQPESHTDADTSDCVTTDIVNNDCSRPGKDESECADEFGRIFPALVHHVFRLSIKIEIRLANALDCSA